MFRAPAHGPQYIGRRTGRPHEGQHALHGAPCVRTQLAVRQHQHPICPHQHQHPAPAPAPSTSTSTSVSASPTTISTSTILAVGRCPVGGAALRRANAFAKTAVGQTTPDFLLRNWRPDDGTVQSHCVAFALPQEAGQWRATSLLFQALCPHAHMRACAYAHMRTVLRRGIRVPTVCDGGHAPRPYAAIQRRTW